MIKILLVEDDKEIVSNLSEFLVLEGYAVQFATGQKDAMKKIDEEIFDLILLDISLADGNGFSVCSYVKKGKSTPIIFLTALSDEYSVVTGFDMGADDYIGKPFRPRELLSRIKNVLRRNEKITGIIECAELTVDTIKGTVKKSGKEVFLSALEYRLLLIFLSNQGIVLSRKRLLEEIWDIAGEFVNDNTLTVYIKRLREKIEDDPQNPNIIKTIRGLGYKAGE